ncbi:hypothetical protein XAB3213_4990001 [Xanthomonas citri pv. bilvae]|nr:hypothetical protein XAB3213_4990001 [Xanthomonas citri pv. bilvae]
MVDQCGRIFHRSKMPARPDPRGNRREGQRGSVGASAGGPARRRRPARSHGKPATHHARLGGRPGSGHLQRQRDGHGGRRTRQHLLRRAGVGVVPGASGCFLLARPAVRRVRYRNAGVLVERLLSLVPVRSRLGCGHRPTVTGVGRACGPELVPGRRTFRFESAISLAASRDNTRLIALAQLERSVSNEAASPFASGRARSAGDARGSPTASCAVGR